MSTRRTVTTTSSGNTVNPDVFKWLLVGLAALVVWYLLTHKKPVAGGSGGGGIVGGGGGGGFPQQQQKPQQSGGGLGVSPSFGGGGGGSGVSSALKKWINGVLNQGYQNAAGLSLSSDYIPGLGETPGLSIPSDPLQLFDVSQLTQDIPGYDGSGDPGLLEETDLADETIPSESFDYGSYSPNDFLVTSDIPQTADLSSYGIDPYYGADQLTSYLDSESGGYSSEGYNDPYGDYVSPSGNGVNDGY